MRGEHLYMFPRVYVNKSFLGHMVNFFVIVFKSTGQVLRVYLYINKINGWMMLRHMYGLSYDSNNIVTNKKRSTWLMPRVFFLFVSKAHLSFSVVFCFWFIVSTVSCSNCAENMLIIFKRKTHIIMHHYATYDNVRPWSDVLFIREIKSVHWRWLFVHTLMASRLQICIEICLIIHFHVILYEDPS